MIELPKIEQSKFLDYKVPLKGQKMSKNRFISRHITLKF